MDISINKQTREDLTNTMRVMVIEINGIKLPLLNPSVSQIIIDVNDGKVAKVRPLYVIKK